MRLRTDRLLVIDVERTCWEGGFPPTGQRSEIIQIGVVEVDTETLGIIRKKAWYVRPTVSEVSDYCTTLTGITARLLRVQGRPLGEVLRSVAKEFGPGAKTWAGWGRDDAIVTEACTLFGLVNPFSTSYLDIGQMWSLMMGEGRRIALADAVNVLGISFSDRHHDALADAEAAAAVWCAAARLQRVLVSARTQTKDAEPPALRAH